MISALIQILKLELQIEENRLPVEPYFVDEDGDSMERSVLVMKYYQDKFLEIKKCPETSLGGRISGIVTETEWDWYRETPSASDFDKATSFE